MSRSSTGAVRVSFATTRGTGVIAPERVLTMPGFFRSMPSSAVAKRLE